MIQYVRFRPDQCNRVITDDSYGIGSQFDLVVRQLKHRLGGGQQTLT
jgi:hypothetical protein